MTPTSLVIRKAKIEEAPIVAETGARLFQDAFGDQNKPEDMAQYLASAFSVEQITSELEAPDSVFLLATEGDKVVGYARMKTGNSPPCIRGQNPVELVRIYVDQTCIGRGYGASLMQRCLQEAAKEGYGSMWLGVWEKNQRALAFYERWGFEVKGSYTFILGKDEQTDLLMERHIEGCK